ncbi:MAG TPA: 3-isopropylmalate dehydratase [Thermoplasmata archaeon]|nr:3-isopropylmalate dehydratase [Thermoplasmata archaeon]
MRLKGRIWIIERNGKLIDDIDTDMIYHNQYLHITDKKEMAKYAFSNLEGWKDFYEKAKEGDIIIAGENFGCGSSRQHAVDCFLAIGIKAIIAKSFGAIYKRNAINSGMAVLECFSIDKVGLKSGDIIEINLLNGEIKRDSEPIVKAKPMSIVQTNIYKAGGLFSYAKSI